MKELNQNSTRIFCTLIDSLNGRDYRKINNEPFMPLSIELIDTGVVTDYGEGSQYSLCHYYEQNGDLMQDPEMCFLMVDNRGETATDYSQVHVFPYMFQQANLAIYQQSIRFSANAIERVDEPLQKQHRDFAQTWLANIEAQGFLEQLNK
ncbi:hypothetical protein MUY27_00310 [Mucilaginibacter sp. RS28]|uniref:DUF6908 domain-containing protein n=1 Tax=Mucilaginibacter straminoryzae TaxID=2932774 RepID=A0A9X2B9V3_9SPHI|nr:hypothetical protein [Mucilaginibacter straminoryzae]MCJ8208127.1 hypothetical protein [Mucilaginibacter straminoryzae]